MKVEVSQVSEFCFLIKFKKGATLYSVTGLWKKIKEDPFFEKRIIIPSYDSILIESPFYSDYSPQKFESKILSLVNDFKPQEVDQDSPQIIEIPVYYAEEVGPDLPLIASARKKTIEEVIKAHSHKTYDIFCLGFLPGFAYLGKTDPLFHFPRKEKVENEIKAGTLAVAEDQTAIYSLSSPGGWHQIGRTPIELIDKDGELTYPFAIGSQIKFKPITREEFVSLGGEVE
jgi:inhibitor of KinA